GADAALAEGREKPAPAYFLERRVRAREPPLRACLPDPAAPELDLLAEVACRGEHVVDVLQPDHAVVHVGGEDPLRGHADGLDALAGGDRDEVEQRVCGVGAIEIAVHVAGRGAVLYPGPPGHLAREPGLRPLP